MVFLPIDGTNDSVKGRCTQKPIFRTMVRLLLLSAHQRAAEEEDNPAELCAGF